MDHSNAKELTPCPMMEKLTPCPMIEKLTPRPMMEKCTACYTCCMLLPSLSFVTSYITVPDAVHLHTLTV
jgi:hypothetical protein